MTDSHCHILCGDASRSFLCATPGDACAALGGGAATPQERKCVRFFGYHPWEAERFDAAALSTALESDSAAGVGEIGLDRLRTREIPAVQRHAFAEQLRIAAAFGRAVVLHGAKCWGEVVKECKPFAGKIGAFLFHGFSRSAGLLGEIEAMNGFVSVGPAILNLHAVNYRRLAAQIPLRMLLAETDRTAETAATAPAITAVVAELAAVRNMPPAELAEALEANAERFLSSFQP